MLSGCDHFTKCSIRDSCACATRYIVYRQAWHFKTSEFHHDRNAKYAIVSRRPIHSYAKYCSFYLNESFTTVLLHVIPHNCSEMYRNVAIPDYRLLVTQTSVMDICQIGYDICEFDSLRGLGIDIIGRVHFDNRDRFAIWMGSIGKATEPCQQTWLLTPDFWQFLEPWHGRWYEYEIIIASCTDNIYDLENERWFLGDMIDHVGIYGSRLAEGLSAFNVGLVEIIATSPSYQWAIEFFGKKMASDIESALYFGVPCSTHVNSFSPSAAYMRQWIWSTLVQLMTCRLFGTKPLSRPMLAYC